MSLLYGYDIEDSKEETKNAIAKLTQDVEFNSASTVKTLTKTIKFSKYNFHETVKVFNSGTLLLGIVTASVPTEEHYGLVYYDIFSPDGLIHVGDIRTQRGNYFNILNKNSNDERLTLRSVYTIPKPCSIKAKLAVGSMRGSDTKGAGSSKGGGAPSTAVNLNITLYYMKVEDSDYGTT